MLCMPVVVRQAFRHHPVLAINVIGVFVFFLYKLWIKYGGEIKVVLFYFTIWIITLLMFIKDEYMIIDDVTNMRKRRKRKVVRCAILNLMAQHCLTPNVYFTWLYSLMAYNFLLDMYIFIKNEQNRREVAQQAEREGVQTNSASVREDHKGKLARPVKLAIMTFKMIFTISIVLYQTFYLNVVYVIVTFSYFLMTINCLKKPLTKCLRYLHIDYLEGLEQYYVAALLGLVEIVYAFCLMVWTLMSDRQVLMLAALYTNIYASGRDLVNNTLNAAFREWSLLAQFDKASTQELQHLDDICAICLCRMTTARKTACKHFFHGHCLIQCAKEKHTCPICNKRLFIKK